MKRSLILLFLFLSSFGFSQKDKQENALFTIRGNLGLPKSVSSKMFHTSFNGVFEGNLSFNVRLFDNFFVGVGYQNSYFQNNKNVFVYYRANNGALSYNTRLMGNGAFVKLGYDKFFSDKGYFTYALNSGLMFVNYFNVNLDSSAANRPYVAQRFSAPYVQPEISANFIVDKQLSFSLMLCYTTLFYHFDPKAPRFAQFEEVSAKRNNYFISWIGFGFGFQVLLNKK
jgi:hypothetical protein